MLSSDHPTASRSIPQMKICVVASAGGHLTQALRLKDAYCDYPHFVVTSGHNAVKTLPPELRSYVVSEANRRSPLRLLRILASALRIMNKERPAVVLSTGAAPGCLFCFAGRLFGARIIWVDSLANVDRLSLSGRLVSLIADVILVQWEAVARRCPRALFRGRLI